MTYPTKSSQFVRRRFLLGQVAAKPPVVRLGCRPRATELADSAAAPHGFGPGG